MSIYDINQTSQENFHAMLDYIQCEVEQAESAEQIADVLKIIKAMLTDKHPVNAVKGLPNVRAEYMMNQPVQAWNVSTNVPESLISTFYDLSDKMNKLQNEDPETFHNASNALHWLANNDKCIN